MRQIKFRGKCVPDSHYAGEWVTGGYVHPDKECKKQNEGLIVSYFGDNTTYTCHVIPDTVGQFSGLQDRYGIDIYEGDIVRWERDGRLYVVKFWRGMFYASVRECNDGIYGGFPLWSLCEEEQHCTIVGNIYDNPELIINKNV